MKKLSDQQFDRRVTEVNKRLEQTANRHSNLLDHLRPEFPRRWTASETEDKECYRSALSFKS